MYQIHSPCPERGEEKKRGESKTSKQVFGGIFNFQCILSMGIFMRIARRKGLETVLNVTKIEI